MHMTLCWCNVTVHWLYHSFLISYSYGKLICVGYLKSVPTFPPKWTPGEPATPWSASDHLEYTNRQLLRPAYIVWRYRNDI